jgi:uncharacterized protein
MPKWCREPYCWLVIAPPLAAVLAGFVTLALAIESYDGLVIDDYYKAGLEINQDLARDKRATALGLSARTQWDPAAREILLKIAGDQGAIPTKINVLVAYASRAGYDREFQLPVTPDGRYRLPFSAARPGRWDVQVHGHDWRLHDSVFVGATAAAP